MNADIVHNCGLTDLLLSVFHKLIYRFNINPIKITASYIMGTNKLTLRFIWKSKRPWIPNTILKTNKVKGLKFPNFKTYYDAKAIKTVWYSRKNRHKSLEWHTEPRNKPTQTVKSSVTKQQRQFHGERIILSINVQEQLEVYM